MLAIVAFFKRVWGSLCRFLEKICSPGRKPATANDSDLLHNAREVVTTPLTERGQLSNTIINSTAVVMSSEEPQTTLRLDAATYKCQPSQRLPPAQHNQQQPTTSDNVMLSIKNNDSHGFERAINDATTKNPTWLLETKNKELIKDCIKKQRGAQIVRAAKTLNASVSCLKDQDSYQEKIDEMHAHYDNMEKLTEIMSHAKKVGITVDKHDPVHSKIQTTVWPYYLECLNSQVGYVKKITVDNIEQFTARVGAAIDSMGIERMLRLVTAESYDGDNEVVKELFQCVQVDSATPGTESSMAKMLVEMLVYATAIGHKTIEMANITQSEHIAKAARSATQTPPRWEEYFDDLLRQWETAEEKNMEKVWEQLDRNTVKSLHGKWEYYRPKSQWGKQAKMFYQCSSFR